MTIARLWPASRWIAGLLLAASLFGGLALATQSREPTEYELKAAILYNFALFTEWPALPEATFNLCLYGPDPFGAAIEALTRRTLLDRPVEIHRPRQPQDITGCHLLYISAPALAELEPLMAMVGQRPILTIADQLETRGQAPVIRLGQDQRKIIFDIDLAAANRAGLRLSSKLLRLAHQVQQ